MTSTDKETRANPGYSSLPRRLPRPVDIALLAADAAIELDELLAGMQPVLTKVRELMIVLPRLVRPADDNAPNSIDPTSVLMVSRALIDANWASAIPTTADLAEEARKLTEQLRLAMKPDRGPQESVKQLRDIALALSRAASAYGPSYEELEPAQQVDI